ncbi:MAG: hypothetical protein IH588_05960 [Anaerolineales bacterium]|nr:hypothetical protein [Anaerolineales bacterium]
MPLKKYFQFILLSIASILVLSACSGSKSDLLLLETFTKNSVTVSIYLSTPQNGQDAIIASFAPPDGSHLYSKDIPRNGVDGLGRPTLLELTQNSRMKAAGELVESAPANIPEFEPKDLLVYPAGAVTLTLPVHLPTAKDWVNDEVSITYMACNDRGCKPPVMNQIITLSIPPIQ